MALGILMLICTPCFSAPPHLRQALTFAGHCQGSIKFFPVTPGPDGAGAVAWLHSVVQHVTHMLYGLSGDELRDRLIRAKRAGAGGGGGGGPPADALRALRVSARDALEHLCAMSSASPAHALGVAYEHILLADLRAAENGSVATNHVCTLTVDEP